MTSTETSGSCSRSSPPVVSSPTLARLSDSTTWPPRCGTSPRAGRSGKSCSTSSSPVAPEGSGGGGDLLTRVGAAEWGGTGNRLEGGPGVLGEPVAVVDTEGADPLGEVERVAAEQPGGVEVVDARH